MLSQPVLAAALRLPGLGYHEFHYDEVAVLTRAREAIRGEDDAFARHTKGPGELAVATAVYSVLGTADEATARGPFGLAGVLAVPALALLALRLFDDRTGFWSGVLLALNGFALGLARLVQYQAMIVLLMVLAVLAMWEFARRGHARWLALAVQTAATNLQAHLAGRESALDRLQQLQDFMQLPELPERMECFDISHSGGEATVASCVVFDRNGPRRADYRKFNIDGINPGDDYAAMQQALERRYRRLQAGEAALPDILFIDGGKGQVAQAMSVLEELQISGVEVIGVAKGVTRKAGFETLLHGATGRQRQLPGDSAALHLVQQIRDEAHRFAITGHRARRDKARQRSALQDIPGVGPKRRRDLLRHFGSAQGVANANVDELKKISGISATMAQQIYDHLHNIAE